MLSRKSAALCVNIKQIESMSTAAFSFYLSFVSSLSVSLISVADENLLLALIIFFILITCRNLFITPIVALQLIAFTYLYSLILLFLIFLCILLSLFRSLHVCSFLLLFSCTHAIFNETPRRNLFTMTSSILPRET